jgi:hypothetical protein
MPRPVETTVILTTMALPLLVGLFFAKRFWHKRIARVLALLVLLPATLAYLWFVYCVIQLLSIQCLGPCG